VRSYRRRIVVGVVILLALLAAGCGEPVATPREDPPDGGPSDGMVEPVIATVARVEPVGADVEGLLSGVTRFGVDLFGQVATDDANVVLSPTSIAIAFGMARAGAAGETAAEIDAVLGFPADERTTHASLNALDRLLTEAAPAELDELDAAGEVHDEDDRSGERGGPPALAIANGVFPQIGHPNPRRLPRHPRGAVRRRRGPGGLRQRHRHPDDRRLGARADPRPH
jgi:hypothetical protein